MHRLLFVLLCLCLGHAHAAWLHVCPASNAAGAVVEARTFTPEGAPARVIVSDQAAIAGCRSSSLPVPASEVAAMRIMTAALAAQLGAAPILQVPVDGDPLQIGEIIGSAPSAQRIDAPMPFDQNLLPDLKATAYGIEERARVSIENGRLRLECNAGSRPAGIVLQGPWYLPRADLRLQVDAIVVGTFELAVADATRTTQQAPLAIGRLPPGVADRRTSLPIPAQGLDRRQWRSWSIACPLAGASLQATALRLLAQSTAAKAGASRRSTWIWNPTQWQQSPDQVFATAKALRIDTLFITIPLAAGVVADGARLASFTSRAAAQGIAVWAVDGDPHMIEPAQRSATLARAGAYAAYNRTAVGDARLKGMQFDVEPYLLPGYELAPALLDRQYVDLVQALKQVAADMPLEMVVPFWWNTKPEMLDAIAPSVSGLTVMDYRTDQNEIVNFGIPFMDWSAQHGKQVRIALEAGPIGAELQRRYHLAPTGPLWRLQAGGLDILLLLKQARANTAGTAFALTGTSVVTGAATTFHGDTARLQAMLPALDAVFSAWPGYSGIALHEFK